MEAADTIAFLAASEQRAAVLASLHREGVLDREALAERCEAARVTVGRNLEKLKDRGIVREVPEGYELTALGKLLAEEFVAFAGTARLADDLAPVLRHVPPGSLDLDLRALEGAEVTVSTRADPYAPVERHERTLEEADEARLLLPAVGAKPGATIARRVDDDDLALELVVSSDVAAALHRPDHREVAEAILGAEAGSIRVCDEAVPYYLGLVDGTVQVGVDDDGVPQAFLESDDPDVLSWAEETYQRYRSASEPFEWRD